MRRLLMIVILAAAACGGDDDSTQPDAARIDASATDGGGVTVDSSVDGGVPDCYLNPRTHVEIINACTSAQKVSKNPVLPLNPDGTLPPLP